MPLKLSGRRPPVVAARFAMLLALLLPAVLLLCPAALTPPAQGDPVSPDEVLRSRLVDYVRARDVDTLLILRDGQVAFEADLKPTTEPTNLYSVTKSIVSLAVGMLLADGAIPSLDTPMAAWIKEWQGGPKEGITLSHVLTHTTGLARSANVSSAVLGRDRTAWARSLPQVAPPGTRYEYNNLAVQLLSDVVRQASGRPSDEFLSARLFEPLEVREWAWKRDGAGNVPMFSGLALRAHDLAAIGQLILQRGRWNDTEVAPSGWIEAIEGQGSALNPYVTYLWWRCLDARKPPASQFGFCAVGSYGQTLVVIPRHRMVAVTLARHGKGLTDDDTSRLGRGPYYDMLSALAESMSQEGSAGGL